MLPEANSEASYVANDIVNVFLPLYSSASDAVNTSGILLIHLDNPKDEYAACVERAVHYCGRKQWELNVWTPDYPQVRFWRQQKESGIHHDFSVR